MRVELGKIHYKQSDYPKAIACFTSVLDNAETLQEATLKNVALAWLGCSYWQLGELEQGLTYLERRLTIAQELEDKPAQQETWGFLMTISTQLSQPDRTIKYYQTQLKLLQEIQDKVAEYICLYDLASFQFNNQQYQEALSGFETALQLAETLDKDSQKNYKKYRRFSFSRRVNPKGKKSLSIFGQ